jgi:hypothetical protein
MDYQVAGNMLDHADRSRIATELGLSLASTDHAVPVERLVQVTGEGAAADLIVAMRSGCAAVVEQGPPGTMPTERLRAALAAGRMLVSLTTRLAWTLDTAAQICEALQAREMLAPSQRHDVELSLHEAIINAVLHGNLAMGGSLVDDPSQFDAFCQRLTTSLADAERAARRIDIAAWMTAGTLNISISDQGDGYDPAGIRSPVNVEAKSGRGLEIMRVMSSGLTVSDGGRTATLAFAT